MGLGAPMVAIRELEPADALLLQATFAALSKESRYLRYGLPLRDASIALGWVEGLDGVRNAALGAFVDELLVGVARYASAGVGESVEVAVTVIDAWQGRRIGPQLLAALIEHAAWSGICELRALVLPANKRAMRVLSAKGWRLLPHEGGFVQYGLSLPDEHRARESSSPVLPVPADHSAKKSATG